MHHYDVIVSRARCVKCMRIKEGAGLGAGAGEYKRSGGWLRRARTAVLPEGHSGDVSTCSYSSVPYATQCYFLARYINGNCQCDMVHPQQLIQENS